MNECANHMEIELLRVQGMILGTEWSLTSSDSIYHEIIDFSVSRSTSSLLVCIHPAAL